MKLFKGWSIAQELRTGGFQNHSAVQHGAKLSEAV
jgi:hypothetical protein